MIKFTDTEENTRYELVSFGEFSIKLNWAKTLVTILMMTIHKGDAIIGQVSAEMHSPNLSVDEKWDRFLTALKVKLMTMPVGDSAEKSELEILWDRIASLNFSVKDDHIVVEE